MSDLNVAFIGRFQPFQNGHHWAIKKILSDKITSHLDLIIGSSNKSFTYQNPFTFSEREEMIKKVLTDDGYKNFSIKPLQDFGDNRKWTKALLKLSNFDLMFSNNKLVLSLISKANRKAVKLGFYNRSYLSATNIRKMIIRGDSIDAYIPEEVKVLLNKLDAFNRIKSLKAHKYRLFTIGHSTRPINEFIKILKAYGIEILIDIRTIPYSSFNKQFNKNRNNVRGASAMEMPQKSSFRCISRQ